VFPGLSLGRVCIPSTRGRRPSSNVEETKSVVPGGTGWEFKRSLGVEPLTRGTRIYDHQIEVVDGYLLPSCFFGNSYRQSM
jgi:hypothetical protein